MNGCCAANAEHDFLNAGQSDVEHQMWSGYTRERDGRRRIAGQQKGVAAGSAILEGNVQTKRGPARDGGRHQEWLIDQQWGKSHGCAGAEQGAEQAVNGARTNGAGERLGSEIDSEHRPIGPLQTQTKRQVDREHRCNERVGRKQRPSGVKAAGKKSVSKNAGEERSIHRFEFRV
nr:hypothetical protein [Bradyrhizobium sp. CCBAU 51745]